MNSSVFQIIVLFLVLKAFVCLAVTLSLIINQAVVLYSQILHEIRGYGSTRLVPQERGSVVDGPTEGIDGLRRMPADGDEEETGKQVQGTRRLPERDALECRHRSWMSRKVDAADASGKLPMRRRSQTQFRPRLNGAGGRSAIRG